MKNWMMTTMMKLLMSIVKRMETYMAIMAIATTVVTIVVVVL
jgi:hypothetical protein